MELKKKNKEKFYKMKKIKHKIESKSIQKHITEINKTNDLLKLKERVF